MVWDKFKYWAFSPVNLFEKTQYISIKVGALRKVRDMWLNKQCAHHVPGPVDLWETDDPDSVLAHWMGSSTGSGTVTGVFTPGSPLPSAVLASSKVSGVNMDGRMDGWMSSSTSEPQARKQKSCDWGLVLALNPFCCMTLNKQIWHRGSYLFIFKQEWCSLISFLRPFSCHSGKTEQFCDSVKIGPIMIFVRLTMGIVLCFLLKRHSQVIGFLV